MLLYQSKNWVSENNGKPNKYDFEFIKVGWLGYSDEKIRTLSKMFLERGFTAFKMKVGSDLNDDIRRLTILRECIGWEHLVMVDANQKWSVPEG